jgi:putative membrane protein
MKIIFKILITAGALLIAEYLVPGISIDSFYTALIVALLLGVINLTIRPVLLLLTFPINFITLGLFTFVINGLLFWFVATFVEGFTVSGFFISILGAFVVSIFKWVGDKIVDND